MRITPSKYPVPGATMTPDYLHDFLDNAELTGFQSADFNNLAGGLGVQTNSLSEDYYLRTTTEYETYVRPVSATTFPQYGLRHMTRKADYAFYANDIGHSPLRGKVCFVPQHEDNTKRAWSGYTAYAPLNMWNIPRISLDQRHWYWIHARYSPSTINYPDSWHQGMVYGVIEEPAGGHNQCRMCHYGYCDAFVHATFSTELTLPGAVFGLLYNFADWTWVPVAGGWTVPQGFTLDTKPLGSIRKVYHESGVTMVPFTVENEAPNTTYMPCYVARIFMGGGWPCL